MSTQQPTFPGVPLNISQSLQNIRLLEIPDELVEIITNTDQELYFKSAPAVVDTGEIGSAKEGNLHLCAAEKSWLIKQVSTSNSVYVTKTEDVAEQRSSDSNEDQKMMEGDMPENTDAGGGGGITAFAKPTSILELYPVPATTYERIVREHLTRLVPTIDRPSDLTDKGLQSHCSLRDIYNHIPAPRTVISSVLAQTCVFQSETERKASKFNTLDSGVTPVENRSRNEAYIASPILLLDTWGKIVEAATISECAITADLEGGTPLDAYADVDDIDDGSDQICKSVAKRMFAKDGYFAALGIIKDSTDASDKNILNDMECARWVGNLILHVASIQGQAEGSKKEDFEKKWEDAVPASWVKYCSVEVLASACLVTGDEQNDRVTWMPYTATDSNGDGSIPVAASTASSNFAAKPGAPTALKGKRKWHEKFASQRSAKAK